MRTIRPPEWERLAGDLHGLVILRLSRLGFELSAVSSQVDEETAMRLSAVVREVDEVIHEVRQFALDAVNGETRYEHLDRFTLEDLVGRGAAALGFEPRVEVSGDLRTLPPALADDVEVVVAEAVHNAAVHARASRVGVSVSVDEAEVVVEVTDDGPALASYDVHGLGLGTMAARAHRYGGTFSFCRGATQGSVVSWWVPLKVTEPVAAEME